MARKETHKIAFKVEPEVFQAIAQEAHAAGCKCVATYVRRVLLDRRTPTIIDLDPLIDYTMQVGHAIDLANQVLRDAAHDEDAWMMYEYDLEIIDALLKEVRESQAKICNMILRMSK